MAEHESVMIIEYLFSSPEGDISLAPEDLARPFLITPSEHHPFLTLGDYFEAIREKFAASTSAPVDHMYCQHPMTILPGFGIPSPETNY